MILSTRFSALFRGNVIAVLFVLALHASAAVAGCEGLAVQVLGSGGPVPVDHRASSGYVVWVDGRSRVLVDAGGGTFLRFGEAGAQIEDLDLIALTHLHVDHTADLAALVKAGFFSDRSAALAISGPDRGGAFPGIGAFLDREFSASAGAYAYLSGSLDGSAGYPFRIAPKEIRHGVAAVTPVLSQDGIEVAAAPVHHGPVPALGYRIRVRGKTIAFGGDQNGDNPAFWKMIEGADLLVAHMAIADSADPVASRLHATPAAIGRHAAAAHVRHVVLSHLMPRSLEHLDRNVAAVRANYAGPVDVARDLECFTP